MGNFMVNNFILFTPRLPVKPQKEWGRARNYEQFIFSKQRTQKLPKYLKFFYVEWLAMQRKMLKFNKAAY